MNEPATIASKPSVSTAGRRGTTNQQFTGRRCHNSSFGGSFHRPFSGGAALIATTG